MVDKSDFQEDDDRSIEEIAADLHEEVDKQVAEEEMTPEEAQEEHRDIDDTAADMLDSQPSHDPEDPPRDDD